MHVYLKADKEEDLVKNDDGSVLDPAAVWAGQKGHLLVVQQLED